MMLLGDLGGFIGAAISIPAGFMSIYSARMFERAVIEEVAVKSKDDQSKAPFDKSCTSPLKIDPDVTSAISKQSETINLARTPYLKSLFYCK